MSERGRSPATNCYNATALQYRFGPSGSDSRGGNVNGTAVRVRTASEQKNGFRCGFWTIMGKGMQAAGPSRIIRATVYVDSDRDFRPEDIMTVDVQKGIQFKVESVRGSTSSPPQGMISSFQMLDVVSVVNVALPTEEVE